MKRTFTICLCAGLNYMFAQAPSLIGYTVIPQVATSADYVKIVTKTQTAYQGVVVSTSFNMSSGLINLEGCYAAGMAPATQQYVDTFNIGYLTPGTYTVAHKAFLSQAQQWCNKIDSSSAAPLVLTIGNANTSGINENRIEQAPAVFPNPVSDRLYCNIREFESATIYNGLGTEIKKVANSDKSGVNVEDLSPGVYFIRFTQADRTATVKFIKGSK